MKHLKYFGTGLVTIVVVVGLAMSFFFFLGWLMFFLYNLFSFWSFIGLAVIIASYYLGKELAYEQERNKRSNEYYEKMEQYKDKLNHQRIDLRKHFKDYLEDDE